MTITVSVADAEAKLSDLLRRAAAGEDAEVPSAWTCASTPRGHVVGAGTRSAIRGDRRVLGAPLVAQAQRLALTIVTGDAAILSHRSVAFTAA